MVEDNVKVVISQNGFEYEVEFKDTTVFQGCCERDCMKISIKVRHSTRDVFKGFDKRSEESKGPFKKLTYGEFCPICGTAWNVTRAKYESFRDRREAIKEVGVVVREAWLSLTK